VIQSNEGAGPVAILAQSSEWATGKNSEKRFHLRWQTSPAQPPRRRRAGLHETLSGLSVLQHLRLQAQHESKPEQGFYIREDCLSQRPSRQDRKKMFRI